MTPTTMYRRAFGGAFVGAPLFAPFAKGGNAVQIGLLLVCICACNARPADTFSYAYAQYGCAPNDALALDFYFTAEKVDCGKQAEPSIRISLWGDLPKSGPRDYSIGYGKSNTVASRCLKKGQCLAATSGTLHLEKFSEGKVAVGSYDLHFPDGSEEKSSFTASWSCQPHFLCG